MHIYISLSNGRTIDLYNPVFVAGPIGDYDDDGVPDKIDTCAFRTPSGVDADRDGIDDACGIVRKFDSPNSGEFPTSLLSRNSETNSQQVATYGVSGVLNSSTNSSPINLDDAHVNPINPQTPNRPNYIIDLVSAIVTLIIAMIAIIVRVNGQYK